MSERFEAMLKGKRFVIVRGQVTFYLYGSVDLKREAEEVRIAEHRAVQLK